MLISRCIYIEEKDWYLVKVAAAEANMTGAAEFIRRAVKAALIKAGKIEPEKTIINDN